MCLAFRACWWGTATLTVGHNKKEVRPDTFSKNGGFHEGRWEGSKYPGPALLALFACSRGPFQLALVRGTSGRLVAPRAAGRNSPWSNGSQGPAYVTHRAREEGGGEEGEVLGERRRRRARIRNCQVSHYGEVHVMPHESYQPRADPSEIWGSDSPTLGSSVISAPEGRLWRIAPHPRSQMGRCRAIGWVGLCVKGKKIEQVCGGRVDRRDADIPSPTLARGAQPPREPVPIRHYAEPGTAIFAKKRLAGGISPIPAQPKFHPARFLHTVQRHGRSIRPSTLSVFPPESLPRHGAWPVTRQLRSW